MIFEDDLVAFLQSGVSITLCSCSAALIPSVTRVKGCRVVRGAKPRLRIVISAAQAGDVLDDVRATHAVAVTFSHITSHKTLQFKGRDAIIDVVQPDDAQVIADYEQSFGESIGEIGFPRTFTRFFLASDAADLFVIEFSPSDVYQQTPGPNAGAKWVQA